MKQVIKVILCTVTLLLFVSVTTVWAGEGSPRLSVNVPLDSHVYSILEKFERLGYLQGVATGTKPYSRLRVGRWILEIGERMANESEAPAYAKALLEQLKGEFQTELAQLRGENTESRLVVREIAWTNTYYDGETLTQRRTLSAYQPLNINNDGYKYADGFNTAFTATIETSLGDGFVASLTPRVFYNDDEDLDLSLKTGYFKTRLGNLEMLAGKDAMWWGQGERGSRALTNNATPQTAMKLSNIEPIQLGGILKFLHQMNAAFLYAELEGKRSDVPDPSFVGLRADFSPTPDLTFAGSLNAIMGGEGHVLHGKDYWGFLTGENAITPEEDKWNSIAGFDARWRIPRCHGLQVYVELYGEDQAGSFPPLPSKNAWVAGLFIPRLTPDGAWELKIEAAKTTNVWYVHSLYSNGYTFRGDLIADAMGNDAERYYARLAHFTPAGSRWAFYGEYLKMGKQTTSHPQTVTSCWITYSTHICGDLLLTATAGLAEMDNLAFQAGATDSNVLLSIELTKKF